MPRRLTVAALTGTAVAHVGVPPRARNTTCLRTREPCVIDTAKTGRCRMGEAGLRGTRPARRDLERGPSTETASHRDPNAACKPCASHRQAAPRSV
jgi:hypothetical protein